MTYSRQNSGPRKLSPKLRLIPSGERDNLPISWQPLVRGSIALPSPSVIGWPSPPRVTSLPLTTQAFPTDPEGWLRQLFPAAAPLAEHHRAFWAHLWQVERGLRSPPYVLIVARGGGKSTTAELGTVALFARNARRYAWYLSRTQDQADQHVESVASILESHELATLHPALGQRLLSKFGYSEGWRVNRLRMASGHTLDAIGLDKAARGRRVGMDRPDLIIIDDIDLDTDGQDQTAAVLNELSHKILPAGTPDLLVIFVQNLVLADGVAARLVEHRADILQDAIISGPHPALLPKPGVVDRKGRPTVVLSDGTVDGVPTWAGQDVEACNNYVRTFGLSAFLEEAQHDVAKAGRRFAQWSDAVHLGTPPPLSRRWRRFWAALDYGFDHPLAFGVFGEDPEGCVWLVAEYGARETLVAEHCAAFDALLAELGLTRDDLDTRVAGHDLWATRDTRKATPETLADRFAEHGWAFVRAQIDRVNGWQAVAERLGDVETGQPVRFKLATRCERAAAQLRSLRRDPKRPNDALKVNANKRGDGGDDFADMARYGVMAATPLPRKRPAPPVTSEGGW